jgi:hypothetical protein
MKRRATLLPLLLAAVLALPAIALAGHPAAGATYTGTSEKGDHIRFQVNASGQHMYIKVTDPCHTALKGGGITIGGRGHFDAVSSSGAEVKGIFLSQRKAQGTVDNNCHGLGKRNFVALRAPSG